MQVNILKIARFTTDKDGKQLMTKDGRTYTRVRLQTQEHGSDWLSGFENQVTQNWKEGDTVEVEVKQVGQYLNFSTPKATDLLEDRIKNLEDRVTALEK